MITYNNEKLYKRMDDFFINDTFNTPLKIHIIYIYRSYF